jgi:zinc D-Ala-D-Ala carboxypeptidase
MAPQRERRDTLLEATHKGGCQSGEDFSAMGLLGGVATAQSAIEPVLTIRSGPQSGERLLIHPGRLTIGRDTGSDFCLNDATVSRLHSVVARDSGAVSIEDAGSANGTIVNGVRVDERVLSNGDVIQIGASQMVYSESRKRPRHPKRGTRVRASAKAARRPRHRLRALVRTVLAVVAVIVALLGYQYLRPMLQASELPVHRANAQSGASTGEAGGALAHRVLVSDSRYRPPGIANLDPALMKALRKAAADAANDGIDIYLDSGWRSRAYQKRLLDQAIVKYGSRSEASRWVGTPTGSGHVTGDAVDVAHSDAQQWLSKNGARYGLCQIYRNEPWHYELRPEAIKHGSPAPYADASHDPRMKQ